jgi:hypothetical protein
VLNVFFFFHLRWTNQYTRSSRGGEAGQPRTTLLLLLLLLLLEEEEGLSFNFIRAIQTII